MKKLVLTGLFCALMAVSLAQKESFDLVSYNVPKGWKKTVEENSISYTIQNKTKKTWCSINIVKSTISKGSIELDFEDEWQELVVKSYKPGSREPNEVQEANGWKIKAGGAKFVFNNTDALVFLTTATGYNRCVSIISTTNSQDYLQNIEDLLASVDLIKPAQASTEITGTTESDTPASPGNSIIGTWGTTASIEYRYGTEGNAGYTQRQYTFNPNGTYNFYIKTFRYSVQNLILTKETGTYQVNGNNLTIIPKKSVIEGWSKKNGTSDWGKLLSSKPLPLEKVTYRFTKHYFSGIQVWNLVLQADKETNRDGQFSNNTTFNNSWLYAPISFNNNKIELPSGEGAGTNETNFIPPQPTNNTSNTLLGTWCISASEISDYRVKNGVMSTVFRQYTFKNDGNYTCNIKTFDPVMSSMFLGRENGTYQINGNNLTINPQKSVLEEWSKKNNADQWGSLLKTQVVKLEKLTYSFNKIHIPENNEWQLILKAPQTKRDGPYNNYERNAWIYILSSPARPIIKLPG